MTESSLLKEHKASGRIEYLLLAEDMARLNAGGKGRHTGQPVGQSGGPESSTSSGSRAVGSAKGDIVGQAWELSPIISRSKHVSSSTSSRTATENTTATATAAIPTLATWACAVCTLYNEQYRDKCQACGTANPSALLARKKTRSGGAAAGAGAGPGGSRGKDGDVLKMMGMGMSTAVQPQSQTKSQSQSH